MSQFDYSRYVQDAEITARASYGIKDGAGGRSIFDPAKMQNVPRFRPSVGVKVIDVIMAPAGPNHPLVVAGRLRPDQMTHICWVHIHKGIGPNQDWFICLARTYGTSRCPRQPAPASASRSGSRTSRDRRWSWPSFFKARTGG